MSRDGKGVLSLSPGVFLHLEVGKEEEGPAKDIKNVCPGGVLGEDAVLGPGSQGVIPSV